MVRAEYALEDTTKALGIYEHGLVESPQKRGGFPRNPPLTDTHASTGTRGTDRGSGYRRRITSATASPDRASTASPVNP